MVTAVYQRHHAWSCASEELIEEKFMVVAENVRGLMTQVVYEKSRILNLGLITFGSV